MTRSVTNESTWTARRCAACEPGKHSDTATGMICLPCLPGQYAESTASASCDACPPGKLNTAVSSSSCQECPTGGFCGSATVNSEQCPAGSYNPTVGATNSSFCLKCEAGKASSVRAHTARQSVSHYHTPSRELMAHTARTCNFLLLTTHDEYSRLTTHDSRLTTHYSLLTTHDSRLTTHYSLLARCREVRQPPRVWNASQGAWLTLKAAWLAPAASLASTKAHMEPQRAQLRARAASFARRARGRRCRVAGGSTPLPLTSAAPSIARPLTQAFTHRRAARCRRHAAQAQLPQAPA